MSTKATPVWISLGGLLFSMTAGFINAIGFLGVHHNGLSHVTGQVTLVSIRLAEGGGESALKGVSVGLWFFFGAILSGIIVQRPELSRRGRRYGVAMTIEGVVLTAATWLLVRGNERGEYLAAMACGLQNAMATSYSGAVLRTTHMTGIVTDLGILLGHWIRREPLEGHKARLLAQLLVGFILGGLAGALAFTRMGPWALGLPAVTMLGAGVVFFATRRAPAAKAGALSMTQASQPTKA
jgi:uncharacterized membrane protein YoaK (UPF0700 family)